MGWNRMKEQRGKVVGLIGSVKGEGIEEEEEGVWLVGWWKGGQGRV